MISIRLKLVIVNAAIFAIVAAASLYLAHHNLSRITDSSQLELYRSKIEMVLNAVRSTDQRLKKTRLVQAYRLDFQRRLIKELKRLYYQGEPLDAYPFIIDDTAAVVMHPQLSLNGKLNIDLPYASQITKEERGEFMFSTPERGRYWIIYDTYSPWDWRVCYAVNTDVIYADVVAFRKTYIVSILTLFFIAMMIASVIISRITSPIAVLTDASTSIETGNMDTEIDIKSNDELGILAERFDSMRLAVKSKISDLEKAQRESEHLRMYLKNVFESMPSVLIGIDEDCIIVEWNSKAQKLTGITRDTAVGKYIDKVLPEFEQRISKLTNSMEKRDIYTEKRVSNLLSGKLAYADLMVYPLESMGVNGAVIRIDDVTDQVQLQTMMIQAEKMNSVAGLAAGMAHEINNPLATITQGIQNTFRRLDPTRSKNTEAAAKYGINLHELHDFLKERKIITFLDGARVSVARAAKIVKNMLMFSRRTDLSLEIVDLKELIDHAIELGTTDYDMKKKYDFKFVDIVKEYDSEVPKVSCCPSEIEQVLLNLFKNSLQAMEELDNHTPRFYLRLFMESDFVRLEVEDNGSGIPDSIKNKIFEPFFTTKPTGIGTGLGLSVSYMIITQNHGGTFEVESKVGKGTKFTIRLPL